MHRASCKICSKYHMLRGVGARGSPDVVHLVASLVPTNKCRWKCPCWYLGRPIERSISIRLMYLGFVRTVLTYVSSVHCFFLDVTLMGDVSSYARHVEFMCLLHFIHSFHGSSFSDCIIVNEANIARIIYHNAKLLLTFISVGGRFVNWMWHRIQQIVCQPTYKLNVQLESTQVRTPSV